MRMEDKSGKSKDIEETKYILCNSWDRNVVLMLEKECKYNILVCQGIKHPYTQWPSITEKIGNCMSIKMVESPD